MLPLLFFGAVCAIIDERPGYILPGKTRIRVMNLAENRDLLLARQLAEAVAEAGGRAYFVGGYVRDALLGADCKDIDIEVYGISPETLRALLADLGEVLEKGAAFGVLGLAHTNLDIAMPRTESRTGGRHTDFDVSVDPYLSPREASRRRDFTFNAMMMDVLSGEILDAWGGREDLRARVVRHVSDETFADDALRVFRAAQFAARFEATLAPETQALCARMDVTQISRERVFDELCKALLKAERPSVFFRLLAETDHLKEFFPEVGQTRGVPQNPVYHPEGDVFEHTMLVLDCAAALRDQAEWPLGFMLAALCHDLGKFNATEIREDGKITAYAHPMTGVPLTETQLGRLTSHVKLSRYVTNMVALHMRPNALANCRSKKKKTRMLFDASVCPFDLILLSRADASGKTDAPYNMDNWEFLLERLEDYKQVMQRPMVTGQDLVNAGFKPGENFKGLLQRARELHFSGLEKQRVLRQLLGEAPKRG